MSLENMTTKFPNDDVCREHLEEIIWGDLPACRYCESENVHKRKKEHRYDCGDCKASFKITTNTIFHGSRVKLHKWFWGIPLIIHSRLKITPHALGKQISVSKPTAKSMIAKIAEHSERIKAEKNYDTDSLLYQKLLTDEPPDKPDFSNAYLSELVDFLIKTYYDVDIYVPQSFTKQELKDTEEESTPPGDYTLFEEQPQASHF